MEQKPFSRSAPEASAKTPDHNHETEVDMDTTEYAFVLAAILRTYKNSVWQVHHGDGDALSLAHFASGSEVPFTIMTEQPEMYGGFSTADFWISYEDPDFGSQVLPITKQGDLSDFYRVLDRLGQKFSR